MSGSVCHLTEICYEELLMNFVTGMVLCGIWFWLDLVSDNNLNDCLLFLRKALDRISTIQALLVCASVSSSVCCFYHLLPEAELVVE